MPQGDMTMKGLLSAAAASLLLSAMPAAVSGAADSTPQNTVIVYTIENGEASVQNCRETPGVLVIPDSIEGCPVTSIADDAFSGNAEISSCVIPDSVKTIGERAFSACPALSSVTIGSGASKIGDYSFTACPKLSKIEVSKKNSSYSSIDGSLYKNGSTLTVYAGGSAAAVSSAAKTIDTAAFFGRSDITSLSLPDSVTTIGDYAFSGCLSLKSVHIPDSVTKLGKGSFMSCSALVSVSLGISLKAVPDSCFHSCTSLKNVSFPDNLISLGNEAFYSCAGISRTYIPKSVSSIGTEAIGRRYDARNGSSENISGFVIKGENGSAAQKYAEMYGIAFEAGKELLGDVNGDGMIDAVDASGVLAEYALLSSKGKGTFTEAQKKAADWNSDGMVDSVDASCILAKYAELSL